MSLEFIVSPSVLIPRHDTETLVEFTIDHASKTDYKTLQILDIGTGSGCIAISLAKYIKNCNVIGIDISTEALHIANQNLNLHKLQSKICFEHGDLFEPVKNKTFDIIVSNPPYIPIETIQTLEPEVKNFEPIEALTDGSDGLSFFQKIIEESIFFLNPKGILVLEVGIQQAAIVEKLLSSKFLTTRIISDLSHIPRVVVGYL